jgi:iron(III) transport system ATP-binding protein
VTGVTTPPTGAAEPAVALEAIGKKFGRFVALFGVTLAVERGEFVCFLGPSGCGKTTLLRIIAGLERQNAGRVLMGGRDVSALPPRERNYGIVFQSYALFPNLSVDRNIAYGLKSQRLPRHEIARRIDELLGLIGLGSHRQKYPAQLSGGEQQRVALARALAPRPALLLLDEPLSALDARVRHALRGEIRALQRRVGITTIMVTHDQEEALAMADRIVVMNQGQVEQIGTPLEVYRRPASPFVARFVGQMNFIHAVAAGPGVARLGGVELQHLARDVAPTGWPVILAIRPEELLIGPAARPGPNRLLSRVRAVQFLGSFTRLRLAVAEEDLELQCDVAAGAFGELDLKEGGELFLVLRPECLRMFPAAAPGGGVGRR